LGQPSVPVADFQSANRPSALPNAEVWLYCCVNLLGSSWDMAKFQGGPRQRTVGCPPLPVSEVCF
jgi:hypothetical protein